MIFIKETTKNFKNEEHGIYMGKCQHYSISKNNLVVGHFYCDHESAFGVAGDYELIIQRIPGGLIKTSFELRNLTNNAIIGELSISHFVFRRSLDVSLEFIHKPPFNWNVLESLRKAFILTGATSKFSAVLFNEAEHLKIGWDYKDDQFGKYRLEELPVRGEAEFLNTENFYLLFAGLFLSEMELQMKAVD